MADLTNLAGRFLIAFLFLAGAMQKALDPAPAQAMIASLGLPIVLIWPVALFDLVAAVCLMIGPRVPVWAAIMAAYSIFTSYFHWQLRADP